MRRRTSPLTAADLRAWIERHQLTQAEACRRLGIGQSTLSYQLAGQPISQQQDRLLAEIDISASLAARLAESEERIRYLEELLSLDALHRLRVAAPRV